jgi:hypothetical protein
MRLDISVVGSEKLHGSFASQIFHYIHVKASAVVSPARIALGILVRKDASLRLHYGMGGTILRGNKL